MTLREQGHGVTQVGMQLAALQLLGRLDGGPVGEHVDQGQLLVVGVAHQGVERQHHGAEETVAQAVELLAGHVERCRGLPQRWHAAQLVGEALLDLVETTCERTHRTGRPIGGAHAVDDGAADALRREPVERHTAGLVVPLRRLDQAERAGTGQLVTVDVAGEVHRHLEHHVVDQGQVLLDQCRDLCGCQRRGRHSDLLLLRRHVLRLLLLTHDRKSLLAVRRPERHRHMGASNLSDFFEKSSRQGISGPHRDLGMSKYHSAWESSAGSAGT